MDKKSNEKLRRQKINVMLNEEERRTITEKAIKYGYGDCLAEYIRAACIYENIYVEDIEGKNEICERVNSFISILREILHEQRIMKRNLLLSHQDIEKIVSQNKQIIDMINILSKLVISVLSVNTEERIQQRMSMIEKYPVDENFLAKVTKKEIIGTTYRPSNLRVPSFKDGYLVFLSKFEYTFDLDNLDINDFISIVNKRRDIAIQKKLYLTFMRVENVLTMNLGMYFEHLDAANKFAEEIGEPNLCCLINIEKMKAGGRHTSNS